LSQPFFGAVADKYGTWRVLAMSGVLYATGLIVMAFATAPVFLHVGGGVLVGLAVGAGSFGTVLSAFARNVTPEQRSMAFGIGTAAGSAGMFLFAPLSQGLVSTFGWSDSLVYLGLMMLIVPLVAIPLRGNAASGSQSPSAYKQSIGAALKEALGHKSYLLLVSGFFVCGYQVAFITAHFPAYIGDIGIDARYAVIALALIGFFNIIGSLSAGIIGQRFSKPYFLSLIYIGRSIVVSAFLLLPQSPLTVILFAIAMGLLWLSTVPPTNALVAIMFGTRHLGLLGGIVFLSHQLGSFLGVWMGGYLYDHFGSYDPVWWIGVALGLFAALVHWPIEEKAVVRPAIA
jgi:MFS family permease